MSFYKIITFIDEDKSAKSGTDSNEDSEDKNSDNSNENSDEDGSSKGSGEDGSDKDSDEEDGSGSDKDSDEEDDDEDSDGSGKKKKKGKMTAIDDLPAYKPSPFQDAMSKIREIMFDLDSVSNTIDIISMKYGSYKGPKTSYSPPHQFRSQSPPRNYYPPGQSAGDVKFRHEESKYAPRGHSRNSHYQQEEQYSDQESDIAPTLSRQDTGTVLPYTETH